MRYVQLAAVLWIWVATAAAEEPTIQDVAPARDAAADDVVADRLDHLRQAAEHLEAAGLWAEAVAIRERLASEHAAGSSLLREKLAALARLQAEVDELRAALQAPVQVLVETTILEVDLTRLRGEKLPADVERAALAALVEPKADRTGTCGLLPTDARLLEALEGLRRHKLAKVLAEPKIVTCSGRPAFFRDGGEFPVPVPHAEGIAVEYRHYGVQVDFVPMVCAGGRIRMEVRARVSDLDREHSARLGDFEVPNLHVQEVDVAAEINSGDVLVIAGGSQARPVRHDAAQQPGQAEDDSADGGDSEPHDVQTVLIVKAVAPSLVPPPTRAARRAASPGARYRAQPVAP